MPAFEIPLSSGPQSFNVSLAGTLYKLTLRWSVVDKHWLLDIGLPGELEVLSGLPLLPGADLLKQHKHLGVGGALYVQSSDDTRIAPGFADLDVRSFLYFVPD